MKQFAILLSSLILVLSFNAKASTFNFQQASQMAKAGDPAAQNSLGYYYTRQKKFKTALYWFKQSATNGNEAAIVNIGMFYLHGYGGIKKNYQQAFEIFSKGSQDNDPTANNELGVMYEKGLGVKYNLSRAINYYTLAANAGLSSAQYNLARLQENKDAQRSFYWYQKSAKSYLPAIPKLGFMSEFGIGTKKSYTQACKWFTLGAKQNDKVSRKALTLLKPKMTKPQIQKCDELAKNFTSK
jgi:uncharacterized protein